MGPTHHLLPNVRFTELRSSEGKSTVRIDRKLLIDVKAHLRVCLFCMASYPPRVLGEQGSKSRAVEDGGATRRQQIHCITFFRT